MSDEYDTFTGEPRSESVRDRLIGATIRLLADAGPAEIKVRRIADVTGVSTVAVYHHFGGVRELLEAVVGTGYRALKAALENASNADPDPGAQLFAMALACRELAQRNPHLYDMMFGLSTRGTYRYVADAPKDGPVAAFVDAYTVFADACHRLVRAGRITIVDGYVVAAELWSAVHGFVTLEIAGHFTRFPHPVTDVLASMAVNHLVGMGDDRDRAQRSATTAIAWWEIRHA
ncbi:TetR/AcrR family transcriptional regulator [Gordonia sp. NPDC058843]|uniref:TetR/AcrR family transcriptional regulator n=1 Tax=Gordonia sp. NPDC058843 TaxID=3346648 RepID=UPI0036C0FCCD